MRFAKILAKSEPEKTLIEHTQDCFEKLSQVLTWHAALINKIAERYAINKELIINRLFLTVALHDIGKANDDFQSKIRDLEHKQESHPLASVPFIYFFTKDKPILETDDGNFFPETLAIASHHNKLYKGVYEGYNKMKLTYADRHYFNSFFDFVNEWARKMNIPFWKQLNFDNSIIQNLNPYHTFYDNAFDQLSNDNFRYQSQKIRDLFILFKSTLHYADWLASSEYHNYQYAQKENYESITQKMKNKIASFNDWQDFQKKSANSNKHIFVQIPTGQGKTEASLLWAVNKNEHQKILFLLPTMVTTNKMWRRMKTFFGSDEVVGLSHGTAQYVLRQEELELENEQLRKHYLYNRTFFKPVTVATVDQLIYSFFNWGYWVLTGAASYNAKIIIDEIHIYDAYTFGLLLKIIECIKPYNTQFAIMSASLPNILKKEIEKVIPDYELIHEHRFDDTQRHIIHVYDGMIEDKIDDITKDYQNGRKVLVVCNTILKARGIFDALKSEVAGNDKMLYHSQFILKDKKEKENFLEKINEIKGGFVAVCTQIVEVSLDIDFDVLYTENAPIDAVIQRLGRVNRKGRIQFRLTDEMFAKVIITRESEKSRKYVYKNLSSILKLTFSTLQIFSTDLCGHLQEKHFKQIVDEVYTRENLGEEYFRQIKEAKELISRLWQDFVKNIYTLSSEERKLQDISSRKSDYITVEAVLQIHNSELDFEQLLKNKQYDSIKEYTLKVPIHVAKNKDYCIKRLNDSDIYLLGLTYDSQYGLSLKNDDQNMI